MLMNEDANSIEAICRSLQLPAEIQRSYSNFGVKRVYDWQRECLQTTQIISGNNLVYCAPTSGGKTLVAELLLLRTVLVQQRKVIFVLPYVSLVMEKERYLKRLLAILNRSLPMRDRIKVRGFYGDQGGSRSYKEHVLVCTIEKANGIFNSLVMRGKAHQLGCVLFDEMHVLGNTFNGYLLEILIRLVLTAELVHVLLVMLTVFLHFSLMCISIVKLSLWGARPQHCRLLRAQRSRCRRWI